MRNKQVYKNDLIFQAIDWAEYDIINDDYDSETDKENEKFEYNKLEYNIFITGSTLDGSSVCVKVENYKPYFYVKMPDSKQLIFINSLKEKCKINRKLSNFQEYKKEFFGFTNNEQFKFAKLVFDNLNNYNNAIRTVKKIFPKSQLYESNFNNFLKFLHEKDLKTTDWMKINDYENISEYTSSCDINVKCDYSAINRHLEYENKSAPFLQATFDIETFSSTGAFPSPDIPDDSVIQISTAFKRFTHDKFECNYIITVKECSEERIHSEYPDDRIIVKSVKNEKELLLEWGKLINNTDPDIIYHYNGDWFDWWLSLIHI
jgi:DNA polymerase elongation subunit (family B)